LIYLDTSVALAHLLVEWPSPPTAFWSETIVSSRLLEFEVWTRLHARGLSKSHGEAARSLIGRVAFVEIISEIVTRARDPFPTPVRTLDALHLATLVFLQSHGQLPRLASYDKRLNEAAKKLRLPLYPL
jgi:predicted nucleic acid-binding protein